MLSLFLRNGQGLSRNGGKRRRKSPYCWLLCSRQTVATSSSSLCMHPLASCRKRFSLRVSSSHSLAQVLLRLASAFSRLIITVKAWNVHILKKNGYLYKSTVSVPNIGVLIYHRRPATWKKGSEFPHLHSVCDINSHIFCRQKSAWT